MKRQIVLFRIGIVLLSLFPLTLAAQFENKELKNGNKIIKNVIILPPSATLMRSGMKGVESLVAESQSFEIGLSKVVGETLAEFGCKVLEDALSPDVVDQNADLKYALSDLQARYDKMDVLIKKKPKDVRTGRFSLGDDVANFSPGAGADALVFIRATGVLPTNSKKAFVLMTGMGFDYNRASLDISIVDSQTGAVLYYTRPTVYGNFLKNPEEMKEKLHDSFTDFTPNIPRSK